MISQSLELLCQQTYNCNDSNQIVPGAGHIELRGEAACIKRLEFAAHCYSVSILQCFGWIIWRWTPEIIYFAYLDWASLALCKNAYIDSKFESMVQCAKKQQHQKCTKKCLWKYKSALRVVPLLNIKGPFSDPPGCNSPGGGKAHSGAHSKMPGSPCSSWSVKTNYQVLGEGPPKKETPKTREVRTKGIHQYICLHWKTPTINIQIRV